MLTQNQLKEVLSRYNFKPLKRFGENYLIDANVKSRIIAEASLAKSDHIIEIGPGFGALTIDLAESGASVYAVEKDKKAFPILKDLIDNRYSNLRVFNADILEFSIKSIFKGKKFKVLGNLPYYITTPIIEYLIDNRRFISSALIVIQKEVSMRLLAKAGSEDRSSISCFIQYHMKPSHICTIARNSFYPMPDVSSSLIRLEMLDKPSVDVKDESLFFRIIRGAFNQRRKSIINSLSRAEVLGMPKGELASVLQEAHIETSARPEDMPLQAFANLTNAIVCGKLYKK